jgi:hypothetical protein
MRCLLVLLAIAGCAKAGKENSIIGGLNDAGAASDGDDFPEADASPIDAPPQQVTLAQTTSNTITRNHSFACIVDNTGGISYQNSYYRVFTLADHGITSTLHITEVTFGIESASAGGVAITQPAQIKLGTYTATPAGTTLDPTRIVNTVTTSIQIPDGEGTTMTVPIKEDLEPTTNLIVELAIPDGRAKGNSFFIGTNGLGERKPGYTRGPDCDYLSPTTMAKVATDIGAGETDIVLTVTGTM